MKQTIRPFTVSRVTIITTSVVCGAFGALSLRAIVLDGPEDGDPAGLLYGLALLAVLFALAGFALNTRAPYGVPAIAASVLALLLFWILVVLSAG